MGECDQSFCYSHRSNAGGVAMFGVSESGLLSTAKKAEHRPRQPPDQLHLHAPRLLPQSRGRHQWCGPRRWPGRAGTDRAPCTSRTSRASGAACAGCATRACNASGTRSAPAGPSRSRAGTSRAARAGTRIAAGRAARCPPAPSVTPRRHLPPSPLRAPPTPDQRARLRRSAVSNCSSTCGKAISAGLIGANSHSQSAGARSSENAWHCTSHSDPTAGQRCPSGCARSTPAASAAVAQWQIQPSRPS